jgi:predicted transcriptional regulator
MHDEGIRRCALAPAPGDEALERAVLVQILFLHPEQLTLAELGLRVEADPQAVEQAVRDLVRDGLVNFEVRRIAPSRAAVRFDELAGGAL